MKTIVLSGIRPEIGFAYIARTAHPELSSRYHPSSAVLFEDGTSLPGPANAPHEIIRTKGGGAYAFWFDCVYFSTSDNSDPRANGRVYSFVCASTSRRIVARLIPGRLREFAGRWEERIRRVSRQWKPARIFWGSLYWACFGWLQLRGVLTLRVPRKRG